MKMGYTVLLTTGIALSVGSPRLQGQTRKAQVVRTEIYRLERQDSCLFVDMNIDLSQVRLAPDCSVFLLPTVAAAQDSVSLPPILLNGPQSDKMYRRRKALGTVTEVEEAAPYLILREGEHPLPRINYRTRVPYQSWMNRAQIRVSQIDCNCDDRLLAFEMQMTRIPPVVRLVHDTIYLTGGTAVQPLLSNELTEQFKPIEQPKPPKQTAKPLFHLEMPSANALAIYFPAGSQTVNPGYEMNRHFAAAIDSILRVIGTNGSIRISGYTSPEGTYAANELLATQRVEALKAYFAEQHQFSESRMETRCYPEGWLSLAGMIGASDMPQKEAALQIIRNTGIYQGREKKLMDLDQGNAYRYLMKAFFPKLRKVMIEWKVESEEK